jgi:hypothetical protein
MAKARTEIPASTAAAVLFAADRTCCVCREQGKPLQVHHVDGDPTNHSPENLAVLCLQCHDQTQIKGGFSRKLDVHQVRLYRDSWNQSVSARRSVSSGEGATETAAVPLGSVSPALAASIVEINREAGNWAGLAIFYDSIGNEELRDTAIDQAVEQGLSDWNLIRLRRLQGRLTQVPDDVLETQLEREVQNASGFAAGGIYEDLQLHRRAAETYLRSLVRILDGASDFTLAFSLKRIFEGNVVPGLFLAALQEAADKEDLWWQVRALEELGWTSELHALVQKNRDRIDALSLSDELKWRLRIILAEADGNSDLLRQARLEYEKIRARVHYGPRPPAPAD